MNVHDSDKLANLLLHAGYTSSPDEGDADLLVINTCSVRDKAESKLYSELGLLKRWKADRPGRLIGVGGCVAQQEGETILKRFAQVDLVFGTHNLRSVPAMLEGAERGRRGLRIDESRSQERFELPERHASMSAEGAGRAFVTVMEGCDMFCTFCVVPTTRGREISRPADSIVDEVRRLVDEQGVQEVTLLGQTVNAYGRHDLRRQASRAIETMSFAELLRRLDEIEGLRRIRYTSPHPLFCDEDLVRAHAELASLCPHVHLPVQSGSTAVLERMRRRYSREAYLEIVRKLRAGRPDVALTTDLIVGFPGESDDDFRATLSLVEEAGCVDSYSFKYSPRPNTKALEFEDEVPAEVASERLGELQALQRRLTLDYHFGRVGDTTEILVEGASRRGPGQVTGRDPYHRIVNVDLAEAPAPEPGTLVSVSVSEATPHSLVGSLAG